jgi:chromosome segregation protein
MGTGLGPESYAIIEQGRIGLILSSKPSDRRAIIEEAAGVSKFKTRKRLAEAKLESSRANLARITDILEELTKQVNSLKRQASKARRHRELQQELRGRLKIVLASRSSALQSEFDRLQKELSTLQRSAGTPPSGWKSSRVSKRPRRSISKKLKRACANHAIRSRKANSSASASPRASNG